MISRGIAEWLCGWKVVRSGVLGVGMVEQRVWFKEALGEREFGVFSARAERDGQEGIT